MDNFIVNQSRTNVVKRSDEQRCKNSHLVTSTALLKTQHKIISRHSASDKSTKINLARMKLRLPGETFAESAESIVNQQN